VVAQLHALDLGENVMTAPRIRAAAALVTAGVMAVSLGTAQAATPTTQVSTPDVCSSRGPIPAADLAAGVSSDRCSLVGRLVVAGNAAVVVPPDGHGVGADGAVGAGGTGAPSLEVQNMGGVVAASVEGGDAVGAVGAAGVAEATEAAACSARSYNLENHRWGQTLTWRYHISSTPRRFGAWKALSQIKAGMTNMRTGHNNCGLKGQPKAASKYLGTSKAGPNIRVRDGKVTCGSFNQNNVVGWGSLPGGLLGWTCYWWGSSGRMIATDMRISPSTKVVLGFPSSCTQKFDLQSIATHEWGHSWGLGHVQNSNLTMHHFLKPCSPAFRTLGLGDFRGMRTMYGLR